MFLFYKNILLLPRAKIYNLNHYCPVKNGNWSLK